MLLIHTNRFLCALAWLQILVVSTTGSYITLLVSIRTDLVYCNITHSDSQNFIAQLETEVHNVLSQGLITGYQSTFIEHLKNVGSVTVIECQLIFKDPPIQGYDLEDAVKPLFTPNSKFKHVEINELKTGNQMEPAHNLAVTPVTVHTTEKVADIRYITNDMLTFMISKNSDVQAVEGSGTRELSNVTQIFVDVYTITTVDTFDETIIQSSIDVLLKQMTGTRGWTGGVVGTPLFGIATCWLKNMSLNVLVRLDMDFYIEYNDKTDKESQELWSVMESEIMRNLKDVILPAHTTQLIIRKENGKALVDFYIYLLYSLLSAQELTSTVSESLMGAIDEKSFGGGYPILYSATPVASVTMTDIDKLPPPSQYVFTLATILLDEIFDREFMKSSHKKWIELTQTVENLLNKALSKDMDGFLFVHITLLRNIYGKIRVDHLVVSLSPKDTFNVHLIRASLEETLTKLLKDGVLGPYKVVYTSPSDIQVKQPEEVPPGQLHYVVTPLHIRVVPDFDLKFTERNSLETRIMTSPIKSEISKRMEIKLELFQFVDIVLVRLDAGRTILDVEVVSLSTYEKFDANAVREAIVDSVGSAIQSGNIGDNYVDSKQSQIYFVRVPDIENVAERKLYALTKVSVMLKEEFKMVYTDISGNQTVWLKYEVEDELWRNLAKDVPEFQLARVVMVREENKRTTIDIVVASLTTKETFNTSSLISAIDYAMLKALIDGKLGGHPVDPAEPKAKVIGTPLLDKIPPQQVYAFVAANMKLKEPWKNVYNDMGAIETQELIFSVDLELNNAFDSKGNNEEVEVTGVKKDNKNVSLQFHIASLTIVDEFNSTLVSETLITVLEEVVEDGDIGGYTVDQNVEKSIAMKDVHLGPPPKEKEADIGAGYTEPGTPIWLMSVLIGVGCIGGTIVLVGAMCTAVRGKEKLAKNAEEGSQAHIKEDAKSVAPSEGAASSSSSSSSDSSDN